MRSLAGLVMALLIAGAAAQAQGIALGAEPVDAAAPLALAEALFQEGRQLLEQGDAQRACPKLAASLRLDRATGTLLALAMCHEVDGHLASAWAEYLEVVARAKNEGRHDREEAARQYAHALEARLSTLSIAVPAAVARIPGLTVRRDGAAIQAPAWSIAVAVDPGDHLVSASAPGWRGFTTTVVVGAVADHQTVTIPLLVPDEGRDVHSLALPGAELGDARADVRGAPRPPVSGPAPFTAGAAGAAAAGEAGAALAAELAVTHRAGWGVALRGAWPTSRRAEVIDGGGVATLRSFVLRGRAFRTFHPHESFAVQIGPELLWQLDRAGASGLAGAQPTWRSGWGLGIGGGVDVPLASWVDVAVIASADYAPSTWTRDLVVANRGDVLRPAALRVLVGAGLRFVFDW